MSADLLYGQRAVLFAALVRAVALCPGQAQALADDLERELAAPVHDLGEKLVTLGRMLCFSAGASQNLTDNFAKPITDGHYAAWLMYVSLFYPHLAGRVFIGQGLEPADGAYGLRLLPGAGRADAPAASGLAHEFSRVSAMLASGAPLQVRSAQDGSLFQLVPN